jgi:putative transposase
VYKKYLFQSGIEHCNLITDNGSENYGEVKNFLDECESPEINHLIAQKTIVHSNSMIEAANKQIKYPFHYHREIANLEQLENSLHMTIEDYNKRPHDGLYGLTPIKVLNVKIPSHVSFASQIANAKAARITENRVRKCCSYSF